MDRDLQSAQDKMMYRILLTVTLTFYFLCLWKMICRILLLIGLTSCVSEAFVVKVEQSSYQAEENHNITLEWTFTTKPNSSSTSLNIYCDLFTQKHLVLYHVHKGVEVPESQDGQFAGRVQCDKDALRDGRIRLHVSRLRTEDSGMYWCEVETNDGMSSDECHLNVTAAVDQPKPLKPTESPQPESPQPESRGRMGLFVGLTVFAVGLCCVGLCCVGLCFVFRDANNIPAATRDFGQGG